MNNDQLRVKWLRKQLEHSEWVLPELEDTLLYVYQELGELSKEVMRLNKPYAFYDVQTKPADADRLCMEFGDVMVMLCTLANQCRVDLSDALKMSSNKLYQRWE